MQRRDPKALTLFTVNPILTKIYHEGIGEQAPDPQINEKSGCGPWGWAILQAVSYLHGMMNYSVPDSVPSSGFIYLSMIIWNINILHFPKRNNQNYN